MVQLAKKAKLKSFSIYYMYVLFEALDKSKENNKAV